jgi:hypothetical protein
MSLPLFAETLIRDLALEAEKHSGEDRAVIDSVMAHIARLGDAVLRLARNDMGENDLAQVLSGVTAAFADEHVRASAKRAHGTCVSFFASGRLKRLPDRELTLAALVSDIESVMLALVNLAARSF